MEYNNDVKEFSKIKAEDTFNNTYANNLLVFLNYFKDVINSCTDKTKLPMMHKDFCTYFELLKKEIK